MITRTSENVGRHSKGSFKPSPRIPHTTKGWYERKTREVNEEDCEEGHAYASVFSFRVFVYTTSCENREFQNPYHNPRVN